MGTISVRLMIVSGRSASALECDAERHGGGMPTRSMGTIGVMVMIVPTLCVVTPLRTLRVRPCGDAERRQTLVSTPRATLRFFEEVILPARRLVLQYAQFMQLFGVDEGALRGDGEVDFRV